MHSTHPHSPRGFTLIELLTVIAIIGILAAILIPTVGAVRRSASTSRDTSNLRQIGSAVHIHINDNKGMLPNNNTQILGFPTPTTLPIPNWNFQEAIDRYLNDRWKLNRTSMFRHRGHDFWYSKFAEASTAFTPDTSNGQTAPIAFGYNPNVNNTNYWKGKFSAVPNPSRIALVGEVNHSQIMNPNNPPTYESNINTGYRVSRDGSALYLFVDGRVSLLKGDQSHNTLRAAGQPSIWAWW